MTYFKLLRIHHWIKNLFLFIPLFFAAEFFNTEKLIDTIIGFFAFSLTASAVYIFNDLNDRANDLNHPTKKYRPIPSGKIGKGEAGFWFIFLAALGVALGYYLDISFFWIIIGYLAINLMYSLGLKNISVLDILILSVGFVLRIIGGGIVSQVNVTHWLIVMIFLLAMFLALAKRRDDILINQSTNLTTRKSSLEYSLPFLNACVTMLSGIVIVSYLMYTLSPEVIKRLESDDLYLTSLFVIAGIIRYLQITIMEKTTTSPVNILYRDNFIRLTVLGWILSFFAIIYLG